MQQQQTYLALKSNKYVFGQYDISIKYLSLRRVGNNKRDKQTAKKKYFEGRAVVCVERYFAERLSNKATAYSLQPQCHRFTTPCSC
jgi:hypothetical protein